MVRVDWALTKMSSKTNVVYYACNPDVFGISEYPVTLPARRCQVKKKQEVVKIAVTFGEQVEENIREWYAALGEPVPAEYIGIGAATDAAVAEEAARESVALAKWEQEHVSDVKPEFGTPAFWAWARAQRAQKNKELAAQGLPPLPTKKELEAAKAAKAAERAAKKAAKEAKALSKAMGALKI